MVKRIASWSLILTVLLLFSAAPSLVFGDESSAGSSEKGGEATATPDIQTPPLFLAQVKNEVYVVHKGDKKKADPPQPLEQDDRILTGSDGKADLELESGGTIEVGPKSDVKISTLDITPDTLKARFFMAVGRIKAMLHKLASSSSSFEIEAGGVVSGVRGTVFGVDYNKDQNQVSTQTFEGSVFTLSNGKEQTIDKGYGLVFGKKGGPILSALTGGQKSEFASFLDTSNLLEQKKDQMMKQMKDRIMKDMQDKAKKQMEKKLGDKAGDAASDKMNQKTNGLGGGFQFGF